MSVSKYPPLSVVLPCYNPPSGWSKTLITAFEELTSSLGFTPEIIIINDGGQLLSEDVQGLIKELPQTRLEAYPNNRGKGAAVRYGVEQAQGVYIIYTDIDFPYTTDSFLQIWQGLQSDKADVVVGTKDESYYEKVPAARVFISKFLRKIIGIFFRMPITDTQCGLKGFNQKGKSVMLNTTIDRYLFDLEFVYQCYRHQPALKVRAQPSRLKDNVQFRRMNYRVLLSEVWNFLQILWKR